MTVHFSMPMVLTARGALGVLPQDSAREIANSTALLLDTRPGERRCVPGYGLPDPLGDGIDPVEVADVIEDWEPRADPADLDLTAIAYNAEHLAVDPAPREEI